MVDRRKSSQCHIVMLLLERIRAHPISRYVNRQSVSSPERLSVGEACVKTNLFNLPMTHETCTFFISFYWECQEHLIYWLFEMCLLFWNWRVWEGGIWKRMSESIQMKQISQRDPMEFSNSWMCSMKGVAASVLFDLIYYPNPSLFCFFVLPKAFIIFLYIHSSHYSSS